QHAMHAPFPVRAEHDRAHPLEHELDGGAARTGATDLLQLVSTGACHLGARHVRLDPVGLAEDPRVHDQRPRPQRAQPVADVADLRTLGVEGADQRDAGVLRHLVPQTATADSAWRTRSIESWTYWS